MQTWTSVCELFRENTIPVISRRRLCFLSFEQSKGKRDQEPPASVYSFHNHHSREPVRNLLEDDTWVSFTTQWHLFLGRQPLHLWTHQLSSVCQIHGSWWSVALFALTREHPALRKWFCILIKCTVTCLYLLGAPPPSHPASSGNQHWYSLRKLPRGYHGNCSAFGSYFSGFKRGGVFFEGGRQGGGELGSPPPPSGVQSDKGGRSHLWASPKTIQMPLRILAKKKKKQQTEIK